MALTHLVTDGTETGLTAANKINAAFTQNDNTTNLLNTRTYDYELNTDILNISDTYTDIVNMTTPSRAVGIYEIKLGFTFTYDTTSKVVYCRKSVDGGVAWEEFVMQSDSATASNVKFYATPYNHTTDAIQIIVQTRKEDATGTLDVLKAHAVFERKG